MRFAVFPHGRDLMLNILENDGVRTLHFGSFAVQGATRIDQPNDIELEYVQQMMMWLLFRDNAAHIVQRVTAR